MKSIEGFSSSMRHVSLVALLVALCLGAVCSVDGNHLPEAGGINLNQRFFDEVRELIKRRMEVGSEYNMPWQRGDQSVSFSSLSEQTDAAVHG